MALYDDEAAFRTIFYQFFAPLCSYAMRYLHVKEDCEDAVQETFLKIWKDRKKLDISRSFRNFLVTAVKNTCIDHLRKQHTEHLWQTWFTENYTEETDEDLYSATELEEKLQTALAKLPDPVRIVFEMSRIEGKTYPQIAEEQHISIKTVEAYITKALKLLRVELADFLPLYLYWFYFLT